MTDDPKRGVPDPPPGAIGLSAIRALPGGKMRQYTAVEFKRGWQGVEHAVRTFRFLGYIKASSTEPSYACLDVIDDNDDIIANYDVPTAQAFRYIKRKLNLRVVPDPEEA